MVRSLDYCNLRADPSEHTVHESPRHPALITFGVASERALNSQQKGELMPVL
jgi:hypothetical protein